MNNLIFFLIIILAVLIEGTITSIPIVVSVLLFYYILRRETWIFPVAFIAGFVLDAFQMRTLASSSIFFIIFIFGVCLYQKKFEIQTSVFLGLSTFLGSITYLVVFGYQIVLVQAFINSLFSVIFFLVMLNLFQHLIRRDPETSSG